MDLGKLTVVKVIVHEIPRHIPGGGKAPKPVLSEIESPLNTELKNYFSEKIRTSLAAAAHDVVFDPASTSPVPALIAGYLYEDEMSFVEMSQKLAAHLHASQTAVNNPGLLIVAELTVAGHRTIGILKLEKEQGVRVRQSEHLSKRTFSVEHIRDLMLSDHTRVFKVGAFVRRGQNKDSIEAAVSDKQRGYQPTTEVADFFLRKFLGCMLTEAADVETKRFFVSTETYINEKVTDPVLKARYQIALLAELNATRTTIRPKTFAEQHLELASRKDYIDHLKSDGVSITMIQKDTDLIASQLQRIQVDLESGIAVLGSPTSFDQHVKIRSLETGLTRIEIEDRLKRVRGKS